MPLTHCKARALPNIRGMSKMALFIVIFLNLKETLTSDCFDVVGSDMYSLSDSPVAIKVKYTRQNSFC